VYVCARVALNKLIAEEGINGTLSGSGHAIDAYTRWMTADSRFSTTDWKRSRSSGGGGNGNNSSSADTASSSQRAGEQEPFPDLRIKVGT
jgi:hypothetical protein